MTSTLQGCLQASKVGRLFGDCTMLTHVEGVELPKPPWSGFTYDRMLDYYDGPRQFLQRSLAGQLYLAWWNDSAGSTDRWIYLPVSEARLQDILTGVVSCLDGLTNPEDGYLFVVDEDFSEDPPIVRTTMTTPAAIPPDSLPSPEARMDFGTPEDIGNLASSDRAHLLDIRFHGDMSVSQGRVSAKTMSGVLGELQSLLDAIGQALKQTSPNMMGRIPNCIIKQTRLDPVSTYSGSFGIRLESHEPDSMSGKSLIRSSLGKLYDLLDLVVDPEGAFPVSRLGPRVDKRFDSFLYSLAAFPGDVTLIWIRPFSDKPRKVTLDKIPFRARMLL